MRRALLQGLLAVCAAGLLGLLYVPLALCAGPLDAARTPETVEGSVGRENVRIAVADISRIFRSYKKADQRQRELEASANEMRGRERLLSDRIREVERDMSELSLGSPRRLELRKEIEEKGNELVKLQDESRRNLDNALRDSTRLFYEEILGAIAEYAKANGIDLVVKDQSFAQEALTAQELSQRIGDRPVLYCSAKLDISDAIIKVLNKPRDSGTAEAPR
jgi:Skp family chaperone for outer membrane proteins